MENLQVFVVSTQNRLGKRRVNALSLNEWKMPYQVITSKKIKFVTHHTSIKSKKFVQGTFGCSLTHILAWEELIESNCDFVLIVEDDVVIPDLNSLKSAIANISPMISEMPTLIQFGWLDLSKRTPSRLLSAIHHIIKYRGPVLDGFVEGYGYGNHCYLINTEMARLLIQYLAGIPSLPRRNEAPQNKWSSGAFPCVMPWDHFVRSNLMFSSFSETRVLRSLRNFADQQGGDSQITNIVRQSEYIWGKKLEFVKRFKMLISSLADARGKRFRWREISTLRRKA